MHLDEPLLLEPGRFKLANLPGGGVRFMLEMLDGEVEVGRAVLPAEDLVIILPVR